ncbi:MAG TPA: hypothetical protein VNM16_04565 [Bacillota bacterium]|nr:hypothetical protein [Bacillota bacterium]
MVRRRPARGRGTHLRRGLTLGAAGLLVAAAVTWPAQAGMKDLPIWVAAPALLVLVALGVAGDMVGVAAAAADESALHAMASRRLPGSRQALALKRNAAQVTSVSGDIVGDVAGTVSGAAAAVIAARVVAGAIGAWPPGESWLTPAGEAAAVAIVAALTVGGKAFGKGIALQRANEILYGIGHFEDACARLLPGRRRRAAGSGSSGGGGTDAGGQARGAGGRRPEGARGPAARGSRHRPRADAAASRRKQRS